MAPSAVLGCALLLCLVQCGGSASSWWDSSMRGPSSWDSLGSRAVVAPGVGLSGSWSQAGSRGLTPTSPISLQCQEAAMVVTVQRDLFGTGKLVQAADLRLGPAFCKYTSLNADGSVTFQVALQDCGNTLQMSSDQLIYSSVLTYSPSTSSSTVITRTNQAAVLIECLYLRNGNVSSNPIKPTWIPFSSTVYAEEHLGFSLRLMNGDWSASRTSTTFQLGDAFNIEASVNTGNHVSLRVFVDSCVATLSPDQGSSPRYDIITSNGCLVDGTLSDSSSAFISPRSHPDTLQFTVDAFRFIGEARSLIYITCNLKAVDATQTPNALNKACSYIGSSSSTSSTWSSGWSAVEGSSSICSCCDTGNCAGGSRFLVPGRRTKRTVHTDKTVAVLGPLLILTAEETKVNRMASQSVEEPWTFVGLALAGSAVALFLLLGAAVLYKRYWPLASVAAATLFAIK